MYIVILLIINNVYAQYIMWITGLDESQAGIKIAGRNNNHRYADGSTLMAESEEELKGFLMGVKEESEKAGLKLDIQKNKDNGSLLHHFMANRKGKSGSSDRFYILDF